MRPLNELFDLTGRVAIVTGGSRGLGEEMAEGLAEAGASLMLCARRAQWLTPTLDAFRDHGEVQRTVDTDLDGARQLLADLGALGISLDAVTDQLLSEGLASFQKSFDSLLAGLERKSGALGRALVGAH